MYLLAIVTLIIGMLSIYAQVLSVQAARIAANQTGLAVTMETWHSAAVSMAANIIDNPPAGGITYPCSLTITPPNGIAPCVPPNGTGDTYGTVTIGSPTYALNNICKANCSTVPQNEPVHLPADYNKAMYQFYSVLYSDPSGGQPYVVTFVQAPVISASNPAPGFISLPPTGHMTSLSTADLLRQLQVSGFPDFAYGTITTSVVNGIPCSGSTCSVLVTPSSQRGSTTVQFTIPLSAGLNNGAIAIASSPAGF